MEIKSNIPCGKKVDVLLATIMTPYLGCEIHKHDYPTLL